jgi:hypothetical protein
MDRFRPSSEGSGAKVLFWFQASSSSPIRFSRKRCSPLRLVNRFHSLFRPFSAILNLKRITSPSKTGTSTPWGAYQRGYNRQGSDLIHSTMSETSIQTRWVRRPGSVWRLILGWGSIGLGLLGIVLPILPGIPLLIFGLVLLSTQYRWAHAAMVWMKNKFRKNRPGP